MPRDDGLAGLVVGAHLEGRVLLGERAERLAELVLVDLGLRLDGDGDHRLGELHALEHDRVRGVAERVTGGGVLEADGRDDVAGEDGVLVFAVVGVHLEEAADALLLVLGRVEHRAARGELAGVDAEVGELADVGVAHDLERERGERLVVVGVALELVLVLARRCPSIGGDVERARAGSRRPRRAGAARPCS